MTPTQRSLAYLRDLGYIAQVVERWNPWAKVRQDLFQIIDILAIGYGETIGVQCTSGSNVAARVRKIADAQATPELRRSGWKLIGHGWRKAKGRWVLRQVDCS